MTQPSLTFGTQLTSAAAPQTAVSLADVAHWISTDPALQAGTERLRRLAQFDREAYRTVKTRLPYIVGSLFGAGGRQITALQAAHYFILDLDGCVGSDKRVPDAIRQDTAIALAFVSPSGEGLKVIVQLETPCTDARQFSMAYRNYAGDFGTRHRFAKSVDLRTADVTRACFLAHDPSVYYNPDAQPVDWRQWLNAGELDGLEEPGQPASVAVRRPIDERPIDADAYRDVLRQINPNRGNRPDVRTAPRQTFVPEPLQQLEVDVRARFARLGWELPVVQALNYGLKFGIKRGVLTAEINVFWGKRGFSVVRSPKTGTNPALATQLYDQITALLFPPQPEIDGQFAIDSLQ